MSESEPSELKKCGHLCSPTKLFTRRQGKGRKDQNTDGGKKKARNRLRSRRRLLGSTHKHIYEASMMEVILVPQKLFSSYNVVETILVEGMAAWLRSTFQITLPTSGHMTLAYGM